MEILIALSRGFQTAGKKTRLLLYLWLVYFLFSLFIAAPLCALLEKDFSRSVLGETIFRGSDLLWIGDLLYQYQNLGPSFPFVLFPLAVAFFALHIFLNGGLIGRLAAEKENVRWPGFLRDAGKYFGRFSRVFFLSLFVYALVFGILGRLISAPFNLWMKNAQTGWGIFWASTLRFLIFLLLFSCLKMFFDYVKIRLVVEDSRKALRTSLSTFRFLKAGFFRAWMLFLLVGLVFLAVTGIYLLIAKGFPKSGTGSLFLAHLWEQTFIAARLWITMLFFSSEYHFLKSRLAHFGNRTIEEK